jgi:hypothetical protein
MTEIRARAADRARKHPLRQVKELADAALTQLSPLFEMYCLIGRPSIPPAIRLRCLAPVRRKPGHALRCSLLLGQRMGPWDPQMRHGL